MDDELRRKAIIGAAGAIFSDVGYDAATTLEIAQRARVSKRDLYRLFQNKQGILDGVVAAGWRELAAAEATARASSIPEMLAGLHIFGCTLLSSLLRPDKIGLVRIAIATAPQSTRVAEAIRSHGVTSIMASLAPLMADAVAHQLVDARMTPVILEVYLETLLGRLLIDALLCTQGMPDDGTIAARSRRAVDIVGILLANQSGPRFAS